jgi:hypothetical protein
MSGHRQILAGAAFALALLPAAAAPQEFNEAFGDTVNWDLIPNIAIDRADVRTNNPVFGLNALGGAINLQMRRAGRSLRRRGRVGRFTAGRRHRKLFDHGNNFVVSGSVDRSRAISTRTAHSALSIAISQ